MTIAQHIALGCLLLLLVWFGICYVAPWALLKIWRWIIKPAKKKQPLLMALVVAAALPLLAQSPVPIWTLPFPASVSAVAVSAETGNIATACFDGNVRLYDPAGQWMGTADVTPGTINQSFQAVAFRGYQFATGRSDEYAIAIRDNATVCRPADVPTTAIVRDISRTARFAVATDNTVYNLSTGQIWWTGNYNIFGWPMGCAEQGDTVWTCDLDGRLQHWTGRGELLAQFQFPTALNSVDVATNRIVVTDWDRALWVLDASGHVFTRAVESSLIYQARFAPNGTIIYGTVGDVGARLVCWDGVTTTNIINTMAKQKGKRK